MKPTDELVNPMLTDLYQLTMAYAYWKCGRHNDNAVFDLFFRENPFGGEFTIFAGLEEVLRFVENFSFTNEQIAYLKKIMPGCDRKFFEWLQKVDCSEVTIHAIPEGTVVFPREPLLRVEGPLAVAQLLETTLLNLVNFPSLVATNAARMRLAAGKEKTLLEFGTRRAQGPNGAISASIYSNLGGFDGTSNVLAGQLFDIPVKGTHAHAYVQSFSSLKSLEEKIRLKGKDGKQHDFVKMVLEIKRKLGYKTHEGELAAFIAYAHAFPKSFLALVDTYNTIGSGIPNFICVALALHKLGYKPVGIRLDSGDLAKFSKEARKMFRNIDRRFRDEKPGFAKLVIVASNDITEEILWSLKLQGHEIDTFGIGTHLATCKRQPALGCVYKLVEINALPCIKISEEDVKITIPGKKKVFRLYGEDRLPVIDLMLDYLDSAPRAGVEVICCHPFKERKEEIFKPTKVVQLHNCVWDGERRCLPFNLGEVRQYVLDQLFGGIGEDHLRALNPTPYKVYISYGMREQLRTLRQEAVVA